MTAIDTKRFCLIEEAAEIIGCQPSRVRQLLGRGEIRGEKVNPDKRSSAWLVDRKSAAKYAAEPQKTGRPRSGQPRP